MMPRVHCAAGIALPAPISKHTDTTDSHEDSFPDSCRRHARWRRRSPGRCAGVRDAAVRRGDPARDQGHGRLAKASDTVKVHYRGTLTDGTEFDSSYKRGQPISFPLNRVIPCWTEGVQKMQVGGKAKLTCPSASAWAGARGVPGTIPPNATLNFEVELLGIGG